MSPRNPLFATDENQREGDPRVNTWMGTNALKRFGRDKVRAMCGVWCMRGVCSVWPTTNSNL